MRVAKLMEPYRFELLDQPIPEPGPDEVLLKNIYLGVCTSDLQIYPGKHAYAAMPVVMGHEEAGIVAKVGSNVKDWKVGDRVILQPQLFCHTCYPCRTGHFNVCEHLKVIGVHTDGCACEYTAAPAWNLHALPDNVSFRDAALIEPMAVGFGVVRRINEVSDIHGKRVCVVGAGTIGNLVAQACKAMGAGQVMITDILEDKLELARQCGVDYAVKKDRSTSPPKYMIFFKGRDADAITAAFQEYMGRKLRRETRTSVLERLEQYKDMARNTVEKVRKKVLER